MFKITSCTVKGSARPTITAICETVEDLKTLGVGYAEDSLAILKGERYRLKDGRWEKNDVKVDFFTNSLSEPEDMKNSPFFCNYSSGRMIKVCDVVPETPIPIELSAPNRLGFANISPNMVFCKTAYLKSYEHKMKLRGIENYVNDWDGKEYTTHKELSKDDVVMIDQKNWYTTLDKGEQDVRFYIITDMKALSTENKKLFPSLGSYLWMTQEGIDSYKKYNYSIGLERVYYNRRIKDDEVDPVFLRDYALADGTYSVGIKDASGTAHTLQVDANGVVHTGNVPTLDNIKCGATLAALAGCNATDSAATAISVLFNKTTN